MPPRSRATRNQEASRARQGQIIDLDPTDGLPVQKYALMTVKLNQDASTDTLTANAKSTNSAEWAAQFGTVQYPWNESPLPSFYKEVPAWNQEMIRRARSGNTAVKLSVWDRKGDCWMSAAEAEKKATPLKSVHLNNLGPADGDAKMTNGDGDSQKSDDEMAAHDSSAESNKSADEDEDDVEEGAPFNMKPASSYKRRKLASRMNGPDDARLIEVKRWVQLPANIAEKTPDRSFLAARRPGMPPLYNPEYAQKLFGRYHSSSTIAGATGYDLGEGGGLSNASGVLGAVVGDATTGTATPPRKNIPPRRKKKKLGGPGRRKANPNPVPQADGAADPPAAGVVAGHKVGGDAMQGMEQSGVQTPADDDALKTETAEGEDNNESGSEAEGSEEGEIDETGATGADPAPAAEEAVPVEFQGSGTAIAFDPVKATKVAEAHVPDIAPSVREVIMPSQEATSTEVTTEQPSVEPTPPSESEPLSAAVNTAPPPTSAPVVIPGLGAIDDPKKDPEEEQIIQETVESIATAADPAQEEIHGVSEALQEATAAPAADARPASQPATELDLLSAMDAAIDEGMGDGS